MSLWDIIVWPFARLLEILYNWTDSYGLAIILFALVVNLILLPFMAKSKKGMMKTTRIRLPLVTDPVPHTHRTLQRHPSASRQHDGPGR